MNKNFDVEIRLACTSEAPVLSDIAISAKQSNGYSDSFMDACRDELSVIARDMSKGEFWVATEAEVIQGFVCFMDGSERGLGVVNSFFINPARQRRGIGKLLWQKIIERAKSRNIQSIILDSDPVAVPFYEGLGFRVIGEVPSGSIVGRTIPRMEQQIA